MAVTTTLEKFCLFTRGKADSLVARPPRPAIVLMLGELERELKEQGLAPCALACLAWPVPRSKTDEHSALACIRLTAGPGELKTSLACWYEWQHPHWTWTDDPKPALDGVAIVYLRAKGSALELAST